jgi:hypothetical protein
MSAQGTVPASRAVKARLKVAAVFLVAVAAVAAAYVAGKRAGAVQDVLLASPAESRRVAFVRKQPCVGGWCETIWMGNTKEDAVQVASLSAGSEHCDEIAWARDGFRVGFIVNGYQLRIFDAGSRTQVGQVNLIDPDGTPSSRIARGVTFSENGAAVTFDDCPRGRSGCKSGLAAVR